MTARRVRRPLMNSKADEHRFKPTGILSPLRRRLLPLVRRPALLLRVRDPFPSCTAHRPTWAGLWFYGGCTAPAGATTTELFFDVGHSGSSLSELMLVANQGGFED